MHDCAKFRSAGLQIPASCRGTMDASIISQIPPQLTYCTMIAGRGTVCVYNAQRNRGRCNIVPSC
eukprot:2580626-Amphidinium_carterae.2